jgi:CRISPR-associated protein Csx14
VNQQPLEGVTGQAAPGQPAALVATLGTQPEVVTIALDLLLDVGVAVEKVFVIHTAASRPGDRMEDSLRTLRREFMGRTHYSYRGGEPRRCELTWVQLEAEGRLLDDVRSERDARAVLSTLFNIVRKLKMERYVVHLSIAGGRKSMSVYGMATAQLLFDSQDRLWHLFSSPTFEAQSLMHPQEPGDAQLVRIPVLPISTVFPGMVTLLTSRDPLTVLERQEALMIMEGQRNRREFLDGRLTDPERTLVETLMNAITRDNRSLSNSELARKLSLTPGMARNRLSDIYEKLGQHLGLPEGEQVDRNILVSFLTPYYYEHR